MMSSLNILNKEGLLTDEDRKQPLERGLDHTTFKTCLDLSKPIQVTMYGSSGKLHQDNFNKDLANFICFWTKFVMKDLNGFSGMHILKFEYTNFEIVQ